MQRLSVMRRTIGFVFVCSIGLGAAPVQAQPATGTIAGRVTFENGDPVHGATVILVAARRQTTTSDDGKFEISGVPAGTYVVLAQRAQLSTARQTATVAAGQTAIVDFKLSVGIHEEVTVTGTAAGAATTYEAFNAVTTLDATAIAKKLGATIADALQDEPGMAKRTFRSRDEQTDHPRIRRGSRSHHARRRANG